MKTLRRYQRQGTFFITVCTFQREHILLNDIDLFWNSRDNISPFAWVILPDHFHIIIESGNKDISDIIHNFKITYSRSYRNRINPGRVWQNRFWDHSIRNDLDFERHLNYIHFNPIKHGLIDDPLKYQYSSIRKFCDDYDYSPDWNKLDDLKVKEFGE